MRLKIYCNSVHRTSNRQAEYKETFLPVIHDKEFVIIVLEN